jgi:hypothetical protein
MAVKPQSAAPAAGDSDGENDPERLDALLRRGKPARADGPSCIPPLNIGVSPILSKDAGSSRYSIALFPRDIVASVATRDQRCIILAP